ncbi:signal peptidase I [Paenibacillus cellulosilyticus]|uniref:Signal peptidase I n=1 Tax=Paenibacillus cellulosilyticus TaxID=375489 RepID=A0A2V2YXN0_9BACL|nr:signal peptidase I [Paenibacillus cellulosilyticus]PWW06374.1 signal peptidase I [Paenibacillus cellulosilyticus]QKS46278.1 signal peptidase I [Paenibacillus cellulosilyticus]
MDNNRFESEEEQHQASTEVTETKHDVEDAGVQAGQATAAAGSKFGKEIFEWVKAIAIAVILVLIIRWLLFMPFIVDGPSMQPNFQTGERVIVNKILYKIREPKRGEVIVFHVPEEGRNFIKRVIGVEGDTIRYEGDDLYVNGEKVNETYIQEAIDQAHAEGHDYNNSQFSQNFPNDSFTESVVPEGHIFVLGDNRPESKDSRMIGFVSLDEVIGRSDVIFWPLNKAKIVTNH